LDKSLAKNLFCGFTLPSSFASTDQYSPTGKNIAQKKAILMTQSPPFNMTSARLCRDTINPWNMRSQSIILTHDKIEEILVKYPMVNENVIKTWKSNRSSWMGRDPEQKWMDQRYLMLTIAERGMTPSSLSHSLAYNDISHKSSIVTSPAQIKPKKHVGFIADLHCKLTAYLAIFERQLVPFHPNRRTLRNIPLL
jgi:hypothetical protein